jgi:hypothetical protein
MQWSSGCSAWVTELEFCEHAPEDFAFWIATRLGVLLCEFCYQAAQVLAGDIGCTACGQPVGDPDTDSVVMDPERFWDSNRSVPPW